VKATAIVTVLLALTGVGGAVAYQTVAQDRQYRRLVTAGDAALREDQTFGAIESYSGAIALRPDSMLAYLRRGETYERRGDLDAAARDFQTAAILAPTATRPLEELADIRFRQQRFRRAADLYAGVLRVDDHSAAVSYKHALAFYREGDLASAITALHQTLELDSGLTEAHYLLGLCLRDKRRFPEATAALERAVALAPGFVGAREELADLYAMLDRRNNQLEQLQIIAGLDPQRIERQIAIGQAHARSGHAELAVLTLRNALERAPDQSVIYAAIGRVWFDSAVARNDRDDLAKAIEALDRVVSNPAVTSDVLTLYGRALLRSGQTDAAERAFLQATEHFPVDATSFLEYAGTAERRGHLEAARNALIRYALLAPGDRDEGNRAARIGDLSLRINQPEIAATWLERASAALPNDLTTIAALVDAQLRAGNLDAATAALNRGLAKDPGNVALLALAARIRG